MRKPTHPGIVLFDGFIEPHNIQIKALANHLGFSRETISRLVHGKAPMTANIALALEDAGISTAKLWLGLQSAYDVWALKQNRVSTIQPFDFGNAVFA
ncbi:HigA family addiction module antitoxin [Frederiksenia canicola]|uniref:Addiction module HigA family antidote n=1 Tax=Frederiksenia canicola TaxID=123824 RepID=A0AAE6X6S2_9PAST|nr:HigA family addiction module antitoxin [Frederiksenia canicola]QIM65271.1 addiction module antidote protein, HigA family [Frederiksenia canicola]RPE96299.1 addiction module HigA family antidote [Frederiksenia canicola]